MDWYCSVFNSDKVFSAAGASILYEMLCEGKSSLVGDIDIINNFYEELISKKFNINAYLGKGFVMIEGTLNDAEMLNDFIQEIAKKHGLSYFEPQNLTYRF